MHNKGLMVGELVRRVEGFNRERGWDTRHQPIRLLAALVSEVGELAEHYKSASDEPSAIGRLEAIGDELADVAIYVACIALAEEIDLEGAVTRKLELNGMKYPASRGSSE